MIACHLSTSSPAFWEGQEGSFLLWMFWHVMLGIAVILFAKNWTSGVMTWMSLIQVVLVSYDRRYLFRRSFQNGQQSIWPSPDTMNIPLFSQPDYLSRIEGNGLNPLLQNYWMTIHPPTLFLGFASVSIPFCFALNRIVVKRTYCMAQTGYALDSFFSRHIRNRCFNGRCMGL
jgi:cytochrome c-type biogenesis protein CcmF